jgi:AdoMet-dependent heme synthase
MADQLKWAYKRAYEGVNYRLRNFAGGRFASHCRPTSIIFLITELCAAKCVHCDIWKNRFREDSPTKEQWCTVLSDLRKWLGPIQVAISGGEALMKAYTPDLVAHASSIGLFMEILTHGYWEDQTKIERLAMANPWKVTISIDGIGETHTLLRGRPKFWERTEKSIKTLKRMRKERGLGYSIRLKNVIMAKNLHDTLNVAEYANQDGMEVFFQPIEQNYNTPEDTEWFLHSENWPQDTSKAIANVKALIDMKKRGYSIANSFEQLEVMIPYFEHPEKMRLTVQMHSAHERKMACNALSTLQFQSNGDVTVCTGAPPVGNVKTTPIREIWEKRPQLWESGCCLERRMTKNELLNIEMSASTHVATPTTVA